MNNDDPQPQPPASLLISNNNDDGESNHHVDESNHHLHDVDNGDDAKAITTTTTTTTTTRNRSAPQRQQQQREPPRQLPPNEQPHSAPLSSRGATTRLRSIRRSSSESYQIVDADATDDSSDNDADDDNGRALGDDDDNDPFPNDTASEAGAHSGVAGVVGAKNEDNAEGWRDKAGLQSAPRDPSVVQAIMVTTDEQQQVSGAPAPPRDPSTIVVDVLQVYPASDFDIPVSMRNIQTADATSPLDGTRSSNSSSSSSSRIQDDGMAAPVPPLPAPLVNNDHQNAELHAPPEPMPTITTGEEPKPNRSNQRPPTIACNQRRIWAAAVAFVAVLVVIAIAVVVTVSSSEEASGPPFVTYKLTASDGAALDRFGTSVAIERDTIVIGAADDRNSGSAYVYIRSGTVWTEQAKLTASDGAEFDDFGWSVALDEGTIVIGAGNDDTENGEGSGSAYVYMRSSTGTVWTEQAKLTASDGAALDNFGWSVALDGGTIVIGANEWNKDNNSGGSAYVYTRSGTAWTEQAKLTAGDGAAEEEFGTSVAINGDTIVIGATGHDTENRRNSGSAYVYTLSETDWTEQAKLTASDGAEFDYFGNSVAVDGGTIVIGAEDDDTENGYRSGSAYVYTLSRTVWTEQAKLTASDRAAGDWFGHSVAMDGDIIIIGAVLVNTENGLDSGSAHVYTLSGTVWSEQAKLTASDGAAFDDFGNSVAIDGDIIVIGASLDDTENGENSGSVYIF